MRRPFRFGLSANAVSPVIDRDNMARRATSTSGSPAWGNSFSFGEVLKWTSATRSNLIHWTNTKIIKPDVEDTAGPGYPRRFSRLNLLEVELAASVNRFRVPVTLIGQAVRSLRDFHELAATLWSDTGAERVPPPAAQTELTDSQRVAIRAVYVGQFVRRDEIGTLGKPPAKNRSAAFYAKKMSDNGIFSAENQTAILNASRDWFRFTRDAGFRRTHF